VVPFVLGRINFIDKKLVLGDNISNTSRNSTA